MIVCYEENGFIRQVVQDPVDEGYQELLAEHGMNCIRIDDDYFGDGSLLDFYVSDDGVELRPLFPGVLSKTLIVADGVDETVLSSILDGISVIVDDEAYMPEGSLTISSSMAADYTLSVDHFPYRPWSAIVSAR